MEIQIDENIYFTYEHRKLYYNFNAGYKNFEDGLELKEWRRKTFGGLVDIGSDVFLLTEGRLDCRSRLVIAGVNVRNLISEDEDAMKFITKKFPEFFIVNIINSSSPLYGLLR